MRKRAGILTIGAALLSLAAHAEPYRPAADRVVLTVSRSGARSEIESLRAAATARPDDPGPAVELARRFIDEGKRQAEPRFMGYAETALRPWLERQPAVPAVLAAWADVLQYRHDFTRARAVLDQLILLEPANADARLKRASLALLRADWTSARTDCARLAGLGFTLEATVCLAQIRGANGGLTQAQRMLAPMVAMTGRPGPEAAWIAGTAAEIADREDDPSAARWYRSAVEADPGSVYARLAYADYLLRARNFAAVLVVLENAPTSDATLLDRALARRALGDPGAGAVARELSLRMDEARARGDETHLRERARFELEWLRDGRAALTTAQRNWAVQKELADLRLLAAAARATSDGATLDELRRFTAPGRFYDQWTARLLQMEVPR